MKITNKTAPILTLLTNRGLMCCMVAEFKPGEYLGLKRGLGKTRRSNKHNPSNAAKTTK